MLAVLLKYVHFMSVAGCRHMSKVAESDEQLTARYVQYFESKDIDHWWLSKVSYLQIIASFRFAPLSFLGGKALSDIT